MAAPKGISGQGGPPTKYPHGAPLLWGGCAACTVQRLESQAENQAANMKSLIDWGQSLAVIAARVPSPEVVAQVRGQLEAASRRHHKNHHEQVNSPWEECMLIICADDRAALAKLDGK